MLHGWYAGSATQWSVSRCYVYAMDKPLTVALLIRLPQEMHDAIAELARRDDRSLSYVARALLKRALDAELHHKAGGELGYR